MARRTPRKADWPFRLTLRLLVAVLLLACGICAASVMLDWLYRVFAVAASAWLAVGEVLLVHGKYRRFLPLHCFLPGASLVVGGAFMHFFRDPGSMVLFTLTAGLLVAVVISAALVVATIATTERPGR